MKLIWQSQIKYFKAIIMWLVLVLTVNVSLPVLAADTDNENINVGGVISNPPVKIVFLTSPQIIERDVASNVITIQLLGADDEPAVLTSPVTIALTKNSSTGFFSKNKTPFAEINNVTINPGSSTSSFYYKDQSVGTFNIFAQSTGITGASQPITVRDTTPPSVPVIITPKNEQIIAGTRNPLISGIADSDCQVVLTINGISYTVKPDNNGNWQITWPVDLENGFYTVYAKARDEYGNESVSSSVDFWIAIVEPTPTISPSVMPQPQPTVQTRISVDITVNNITNSFDQEDIEPTKNTFNNEDMFIGVNPSLDKPVYSVVGFFESVEYAFSDENNDGIYETNIISPWYTGQYILKVVVTYEDGQTEQLDVVILVDPYGYVYELAGDQQMRVQGAEVTLWSYENGEWIKWDASKYGQTNSQITLINGEYGFIVPEGLYYLTCEKDGYVFYQSHTMYVEEGRPVNINVLIRRIGLLTLGEKIIENIKAWVASLSLILAPYVYNELALNNYWLIHLVNLGLLLTLFFLNWLLNTSLLSPWSRLLSKFMAWFGIIQKPKNNWGIVYDAENNQPLALVKVNLCDLSTKEILDSSTTNQDGKYGFSVKPGKYYIEVFKKDYVFPSRLDKRNYHKQIITINKDQKIKFDIPMDPKLQKLSNKISLYRSVYDVLGKVSNITFVIGIVVSFGFAVVIGGGINYLVFLIYVIVLLTEIINYFDSSKIHANLVDDHGKPVDLAIVRLFDDDGRITKTKTVDKNGMFSILVKKGIHRIEISKYDYDKFIGKEYYFSNIKNLREKFVLNKDII